MAPFSIPARRRLCEGHSAWPTRGGVGQRLQFDICVRSRQRARAQNLRHSEPTLGCPERAVARVASFRGATLMDDASNSSPAAGYAEAHPPSDDRHATARSTLEAATAAAAAVDGIQAADRTLDPQPPAAPERTGGRVFRAGERAWRCSNGRARPMGRQQADIGHAKQRSSPSQAGESTAGARAQSSSSPPIQSRGQAALGLVSDWRWGPHGSSPQTSARVAAIARNAAPSRKGQHAPPKSPTGHDPQNGSAQLRPTASFWWDGREKGHAARRRWQPSQDGAPSRSIRTEPRGGRAQSAARWPRTRRTGGTLRCPVRWTGATPRGGWR